MSASWLPCSRIAAALDHEDLVGHAHRREAVRDQDHHAVVRERLELLEDLRLGPRVHRGGRLVEHEDVGTPRA